MKFLVAPIILLLWVAQGIMADDGLQFKSSIKEDLKKLKETCHQDSCTDSRITDSLKNFTCQCGVICSQLGTCCVDSPYLVVPPPNLRPLCRSLDDGRSYYMVDRCSNDGELQSLCESERTDDGDVKKILPVTSLFTFITYKNYFCFRCNEQTDNFVYWDVRIRRFDEFDQTVMALTQIASLTYDRSNKTWFAPFGPGDGHVSVKLSMQVPPGVGPMISECDPLVISNCSKEWVDLDVRYKCEAYMGVIEIVKKDSVLKYKNMHCALCNLEDLNDVFCKSSPIVKRSSPFRFSVPRIIQQPTPECGKGFILDPFMKKCRKIVCPLPGYVLKNNKCVRNTSLFQ